MLPGEKCNPCLRNVLLPMSRVGQGGFHQYGPPCLLAFRRSAERQPVSGIPAQTPIRLALGTIAPREGAFLNVTLLEPPFRPKLSPHPQDGRDAFGQRILLLL
jgi:hypothetical protein